MSDRRQDFELLQRFTRDGEQSAFADLVRRHLDLVFAAALRKVEDSGAAQEVAQNVFAGLARKAWRFAPDDSLPAWLHKAALLESKFWLRGELARRRREQTAAELGTSMNPPENEAAFHALLPLLDDALLSLREKDRTALLLRFYESQSLRDVGTACGISEDTAQKRVQSALEKLAKFFQRRGFKTATVAAAAAALQHTATTTSAGMAIALVGAVWQAAPPALVGLGAWLARLMTLTRMQTAAVCVALAAIPVGWQLNEGRVAGRELRRMETQLVAGQSVAATLPSEIARLRMNVTRGEQFVAQANEAAARAAANAQAFAEWKQKIRAPLLAADYRWDDDSPFVRIPKAVLPELVRWSYAEPFAPSGIVEPYARELMGMTRSEHQAVEASLQRHLGNFQARLAAGIQETNGPVGGQGVTNKLFVQPELPEDELKERQDQLLAELRALLGKERWPLVEVRFQERRGVPRSAGGLLVNLNLKWQQHIGVGVEIDDKGLPRARWTMSAGGVVGGPSWDLSTFLPEGDPNGTKHSADDLGAPLVAEALRRRAFAWLQEQAIARLGKKESP